MHERLVPAVLAALAGLGAFSWNGSAAAHVAVGEIGQMWKQYAGSACFSDASGATVIRQTQHECTVALEETIQYYAAVRGLSVTALSTCRLRPLPGLDFCTMYLPLTEGEVTPGISVEAAHEAIRFDDALRQRYDIDGYENELKKRFGR